MTDTVTDAPVETPALKDPMLTAVRDQMSQVVEQAATIAKRLNASEKGVKGLCHDVFTDENVHDDTLDKARAYVADLDEKREAAIQQAYAHIQKNYLDNETLSDDEKKSLRETLANLRKSYKASQTFASIQPAYDEAAFNAPAFPGLRAGTGEGGKKPRLSEITINGERIFKTVKDAKTGEDVEVSNFSNAAAWLTKDSKTTVAVKDLQAAAFEAAGTDDLSTLSGQPFEFVFSAGDNNYTVVATPKES